MARNILVVEDDHNISDLIRMYLEKEGFEVRIAYDGGKAVEEYDAKAPDMVLLDIMLPVMDGWAVCAHIREKGKTPIIMLTAKGDVTDRITGLEMGAVTAICSATYSYATQPSAELFGVDYLLSVRPQEDQSGNFTGRWIEPITYQQGKVTAVEKLVDELKRQIGRAHV